MTPQEVKPIERCCPRHDDWGTLAAHLCEEFAELPETTVMAEVVRARRVVELFGIDDGDQADMADLICRYQLSVMAGRFEDVARLDPQHHDRGCSRPPD